MFPAQSQISEEVLHISEFGHEKLFSVVVWNCEVMLYDYIFQNFGIGSVCFKLCCHVIWLYISGIPT